HNVLVYASWGLVVTVWLYLTRTRPGLNLRAVGDAPAAADAMGINVAAYRYAHTLVGGALAGVAGATFTLAINPQWFDNITDGSAMLQRAGPRTCAKSAEPTQPRPARPAEKWVGS